MKLKELFENTKQRVNINIHNSSLSNLPDHKIIDLIGDFDCSNCVNLTSLEGSPSSVTGNFKCWRCNFPTLKGASKKVTGEFYINECDKLTSLEGAPDEVIGIVTIASCNKLKSLSGIGINYLLKINGSLDLYRTSIESNILGLLKVKDLEEIINLNNKKAQKIINKHLHSGRRLSKCKEELIEAGLKEFAKL
jgi:hypothetical protein